MNEVLPTFCFAAARHGHRDDDLGSHRATRSRAMMPQCRHQRGIKLSLPRGSAKTPQVDIYLLPCGIRD
ncbi:MAG: hypothetical protein NTY08_02220 [Proteobacteria bacterium]|nr:hypothetical protein [Pseudomonadota bacterium]